MIDSTIHSKASIFPCDCGTEGLVVIAESETEHECEGAPFINVAFMGVGSYADGRLSWGARLRWIWRITRTGNPYTDMVTMRSNVAKKFAYHILYLLSRNKLVRPESKYPVGLPERTPDQLPSTWGQINCEHATVGVMPNDADRIDYV